VAEKPKTAIRAPIAHKSMTDQVSEKLRGIIQSAHSQR